VNVVVETLKRAAERDNALEELCRSFPSAGAFARILVDEGQKTERDSFSNKMREKNIVLRLVARKAREHLLFLLTHTNLLCFINYR